MKKNKERKIINFKSKISENLFVLVVMSVLSFITMTLTFVFSRAVWDMEMFLSYFQSPKLLILNFLPIFLLFMLVYLISNRLYLGYIVSSGLWVTFSIINKFKLTYRDDPFKFIDILLVRESMDMAQKYPIVFSRNMIIMVIGIITITVMLYFFANYKIEKTRIRIASLIFVILVSYFLFDNTYSDSKVYAELGDQTLINPWSKTQQYQAKGFVYPFIHSIREAFEKEPEGYDKEEAKEILSSYKYNDIPEDKKVNIIAIMLEAYSDFSKYENIIWKENPYEYFQKLQSESYHGNLITDVFGGGTVETERSFLTGYHNHPRYYKDTNSFVWYFVEQGYYTEAMHPIYGWFYNRRNVNEYLGFNNFDYYENKYSKISEYFFMDYDFFDFIIEGYEKSTKPYFNFSVTYQNHGPYSEEYVEGNDIIEFKEGYDEKAFNIVNNYLAGIKRTDEAIEKLIEYFREQEEPTVVVLFGDHKPWLGNDDIGYKMLGIDIDMSTPQGMVNYYEAPYIIWGNDSAKDVFGDVFKGEGNTISPNFLMPELFNLMGLKGNEYMQYINDLKQSIDVLNKVYYKENGEYTNKLSKENEELLKQFINVEFYYSHNFIKK
jgi:phosphoglycerol transferase MdoB-like AlkP superfamily enzyme